MREAERIISYLSLYDYAVDGVVLNRVFCDSNGNEQADGNSRRQRELPYLTRWPEESLPFTMDRTRIR